MDSPVKVRHIYEHDADVLEKRLNEELGRILSDGYVIADIQYASDAASPENPRGGFGVLVVYEKDEE